MEVTSVLEKYGTLYSEFRYEEGLKFCLFYPIYFTRRLQYILTQIFCVNNPILQLSLNIIFAIFQFSYLFLSRPFKEKQTFIAETLGQSICLFAIILTILIYRSPELAKNKTMDYVFIYSILFILTILTFFSIQSLIVTLKEIFISAKKYFITKKMKLLLKVHPAFYAETTNDISLPNAKNEQTQDIIID